MLYLHIGLPKTGTTTLQYELFPDLDRNGFEYAGVRQPRTENQTSFYRDLMTAAYGRASIPLNNGGGARWIILSDEMLTVSSGSISWRQKLANLSDFLGNIDYRVLVTVRDPVDAMFSYYVELYHQFRRRGKSFEELARHEEAMEIFHYDKLRQELDAHFPGRWYCQSLEGIKDGKFNGLEQWLERPIDAVQLQKQRRNTTQSSGNFVISGQKASLRDFFGLPSVILPRPQASNTRFHPSRILNAVYSRVAGKRVFRQKVRRPSELTLNNLRRAVPAADLIARS